MIYEFRTYQLKPRSMGEVIKRFGDALPRRAEFSPLAAFWHTEIGPLNQIIHVWPYESLAQRDEIRAAAAASGVWPPKLGEFIVDMQSEILTPVTSQPALVPGTYGPYYEMRTYTLAPGSVGAMTERWEEYLPGRIALSPLAGVFWSDIGALNKWIHIWPYPSLEARVETRKQAAAAGSWPPPGDSPVLDQSSKIIVPAPFSPMQ